MLERFLDQIGEVLRLCEDTDGILVVNREGIIEYHRIPLNSYWCSQDTVGRHILELYPELDGESSTILTALRTGRASYNVLQDINNHRGERVLLESTTIPIVVDGRVECVVDSSKYHTIDQRVIRGGEGGGLSTLDRMLTEDPAMLALKSRIRDVAGLDSSVLIYGETGTGKELVAESLHSEGGRAGPFVSQNCAAIPATLLESLFFGTEKGSYTGALTRKGLLEEADGGTLFLDEINSMDPALQAKLLKVLEEKKVRRLGGSRDIPFDVRIVAAVNEKPQKLIREGRLREDLYYRLGVIRLTLPPLRERLCDIGPLADYFIEHYNRKLHRRVRGLSERALRLLRGYAWPGNVRELKNAIEGAVAVARGERLTVEDMEEKKVRRLGGSRDIPFDVRIVAAVNEKPQKLIREGRLREDLYYRLGVIRLTLPPLRERLCDIGPLADYFIEHYNRKLHRRVRGLSERALRLLRGYAWPGNVRELKNAIEGAVAVARGERLTVEDMEEILAGRLGGLNRPPELPEALRLEESFSLTRALDSYERELLSRAMQQAGSISQAARLLGLSRQNLKYKLKKFDL